MPPMRRSTSLCIAAVLAVSFEQAAIPAVAQAEGSAFQPVGPSMPCTPTPVDALNRLSCSDPTLARADIRLVQTYYAMRGAASPDARKAMKSRFLSMIIATRQKCGLPAVAPGTDQSAIPLPGDAAACVATAYDQQHDTWLSTLSGPAEEEAKRAPERNIALQGKLQALGFLPRSAVLDGIFGTGVRDAISRWQTLVGRSSTGFLADADVLALETSSTPAAAPADPLAGFRSKALAAGTLGGQPLSLSSQGLSVEMDLETVHDAAICMSPFNGGFGLDVTSNKSRSVSCEALVGKLSVDGKVVHQVDLAAVDDHAAVEGLNPTVAIRRLDGTTVHPQVVFTGYSGGAHCCTSTIVAIENKDGGWSDLSLGQLDGDRGYDFIEVPGSNHAVLTSYDARFNSAFASYAGSYAPTRVQTVVGSATSDISRDPRYRDFMVQRLRTMESQYQSHSGREPNGYYAGWVAQKALVGEFDGAWHVMLGSYDHDAGFVGASTDCAIDKQAWPKDGPGSGFCPAGQEITVPFPQALATSLVDMGYVTVDQAKSVGIDIPKIEADRLAARREATAAYEEAARRSWFMLMNDGTCTQVTTPSSPADLVSSDRENGLEDTVNVLQQDTEGKATAVRIGEPRGGGLERITSFYRGATVCEAARQKAQSQLDELR